MNNRLERKLDRFLDRINREPTSDQPEYDIIECRTINSLLWDNRKILIDGEELKHVIRFNYDCKKARSLYIVDCHAIDQNGEIIVKNNDTLKQRFIFNLVTHDELKSKLPQ